MRTVHKFPLDVPADAYTVAAPLGPVVLVEPQRGVPTLWIEVQSDHTIVNRSFHLFGTGQEIPDTPTMKHVGSFQMDGFVWHIYEDEGAWKS